MRPSLPTTEHTTSVSLDSLTGNEPRQPSKHILARWWTAVVAWVQGPNPPVDVTFSPLFRVWQSMPAHKLSTFLKTRRKKQGLLAAFFLVWFVLFAVVVHYSLFADMVEETRPTHLSCTSSLWSKNSQCGLDGLGCMPFANNSLAFRCPSNCKVAGQVLNPRAVGAEVVSYSSYVIGGPGGETLPGTTGNYRADSFICPAAIHAGLVSERYGGCGIMTRTGSSNDYPSSHNAGIKSIGFDATFPSSYGFTTTFTSTSCRDLRYHLFAVSIPFTIALSILCTHPATTYYTLFTTLFFHVALASDPPYITNPDGLVSRALSRYLPAIFIAHTLWTFIFARIHNSPLLLTTAHVERTILFLGGLWVGALNNFTFDVIIPINRLTGIDLETQPGAKAALAVVCIVLFFIVVGQVHYFRISGRLPGMLGLYAGVGVGLGLLAAIPGNSLRIHHYILALLLLPGTKLLTRPSLLYQGLLLGLFINGIARWGFAGIVETPIAIIGDGVSYTDLPTFIAPDVARDNVTVHWETEKDSEWEGVSVLVNDVERVRWSAKGETEGSAVIDRIDGEKTYLRLGYYKFTGEAGDYTRAGVVWVNGTWEEPEEGWT